MLKKGKREKKEKRHAETKKETRKKEREKGISYRIVRHVPLVCYHLYKHT